MSRKKKEFDEVRSQNGDRFYRQLQGLITRHGRALPN